MITDTDPPRHGFPKYTVTFTVSVAAPRAERAAFLAWEHIADRLEYQTCEVVLESSPWRDSLEFCPSVEQQHGEGQTPYARNFNP